MDASDFSDDRLDGSFLLVDGHARTPAIGPSLIASSASGTTTNDVPLEAGAAHNWDPRIPGNKLSIQGKHLVDEHGRVCLPRGVNLSGSSKTPPNHDPKSFPSKYVDVTFVGRPFSLEDAPEHFARLRRWGLTFVRFLVTWEALEPAGPGQHDASYISYLRQLLSLMSDYGIVCIVSMHQDVWSRFSGGSGAPAWTLEAVGFDLAKLEESGAAYLGGVREPGIEAVKGRWPTGYLKLASATMWTCFWAGDVFAPNLLVQNTSGEKVGIQTFLQSAFFACFEHLAAELDSIPSIIGWECLNEPHAGYVNLPSLHEFNYYTELHFHDTPSALQSFALGSGHTLSIPHYIRSFPFPTRISHHATRNESQTNVWREDGPTNGQCIWAMHGVWDWDEGKKVPVALRENYFCENPVTRGKVDWYVDCWYPFVKRWAEGIHRVSNGSRLLFVEGIPNEARFCPPSWKEEHRVKNMVFAPHWYDLNSLFTKSFGNLSVNVQGLSRGMFLPRALYWGPTGAKANYRLQISRIVQEAHTALEGNVPVVIGECGIPMDMNGGEAFRTGDFSWQQRALDALMHALESTLVSFTLWNYNPDNDDVMGDYWNGENFSWFSQSRARPRSSKSQSLAQTDPSLDQGARLLSAVVRPYPAKIAGAPISFELDSATGNFSFKWASMRRKGDGNSETAWTTEIFLPASVVGSRQFEITGLRSEDRYTYRPEMQTLSIVLGPAEIGYVHEVRVIFEGSQRGWLSSASLPAMLALMVVLFAVFARIFTAL